MEDKLQHQTEVMVKGQECLEERMDGLLDCLEERIDDLQSRNAVTDRDDGEGARRLGKENE
jgi:hypothetical protein